MLDAKSGKSRAQRIELDYFRRPDTARRIKWIGSAVVALACAAYAVFVIVQNDGNSRHVNTGPLALAHADLEENCQSCHTPFQPLASDAFLADDPHHRQMARQKCEQCHPNPHDATTAPQAGISLASETASGRAHAAGAPSQSLTGFAVAGHFDAWLNPAGESQAGCVLCHREHQGRGHDLRAVANAACVSCHGDLSSVVHQAASRQVDDAVTAFASGAHPEFWYGRDDATDPGSIRFDHHQHLLPGQVPSDQRGGFRWEQLPIADRGRYLMDSDGFVQLACRDCHERSDTVLGATDVEEGRTFAPVQFDQHCAACHELNFPTRDEDVQPVPHAASWDTVRRLLRGAIGGHLLASSQDASTERTGLPKIPGTSIGNGAAPDADLDKLDQLVEQGVEMLRGECHVCHAPQDVTDQAIHDAHAGLRHEMIPQQWLRRGMFNHAAHAELDCRRCHDAAFPTAGDGNAPLAAADHDQAMIRGIESCTGCHQRAAGEDSLIAAEAERGEEVVPASAQCTLCHRYHWTRPPEMDSSLSAALDLMESAVGQTTSHTMTSDGAETAYQILIREVLQ